MKQIKIKFPVILLLGFSLALVLVGFILTSSNSYNLKIAALNTYNYPSKESVSNYFNVLNNILIDNKDKLDLNTDFKVFDYDLANSYINKLSQLDKSFSPTYLKIEQSENIIPIDFKYIQKYDDSFPLGYSYVNKGERGANITYVWNINYKEPTRILTKSFNAYSSKLEPKNEIIYFGQKDIESLDASIKTKFSNLLQINENDLNFIYPQDKTKLENIGIDSITYFKNEHIILNEQESFVVGKLNIKLGNCNKSRELNFEYNSINQSYEFQDFQEFLDNLCIKQFIEENGYLIGTCIECTLYPIDKTHAVKPDYTPEVLSVDFAPGFQRINKVAFNDFYELYKAARADKVNLMVTSGYRSYTDQLNTFNYWTSVEMSKGYSRAQAEAIANTYSARPGFSEHQLGTALDLNGAGCDSFNNSCTGNQAAWDWLANNAYRFGFVISYPESKQSQTGYIYEPWHYRWIGKELASEYKKIESSTYLQRWLFDLGRY